MHANHTPNICMDPAFYNFQEIENARPRLKICKREKWLEGEQDWGINHKPREDFQTEWPQQWRNTNRIPKIAEG
jgi:hypothetical protein